MYENTMLVPQTGINMEQATANCEELAKAIREMTAGGQLYHEAHRLSVEDLRERGMVEEVTTAMERRRQAHGRA